MAIGGPQEGMKLIFAKKCAQNHDYSLTKYLVESLCKILKTEVSIDPLEGSLLSFKML